MSGRPSDKQFDVAIVGASVAGCTAARLFAEAGASVALIEKSDDTAAYKVVCTHAILPPATRTIERLGLAARLAERGAPRTWAQFWTPYGGWFGVPEGIPDGWGVTRRTLDPMLRQLALESEGVEHLGGQTAKRVLFADGRPVGVEVEDHSRARRRVRARLLVGADGRGSTIARLAGVPGRVRPHNRFFYFSYWRGVEQAESARGPSFRLWLMDPDGAAEFPNEDGLSVLVGTYHRSRLDEVRADPEAAYMRTLESLPDGPDLRGAERVSKLLGKLEVPNVIRPAARPGVAFIGDAALATDPVFGVGISFAFRSAEWLVDEAAGALGREEELDRALRRYRRKFAWRLAPHHLQIADFSVGRKARPWERRAFRRATVDPAMAGAISEVMSRERSPMRLADPRIAARLLAPERTASGPA